MRTTADQKPQPKWHPVILASRPLRHLAPVSQDHRPYSLVTGGDGLSPLERMLNMARQLPGCSTPIIFVSSQSFNSAYAQISDTLEKDHIVVIVPSDTNTGLISVMASVIANSIDEDANLLFLPVTTTATDPEYLRKSLKNLLNFEPASNAACFLCSNTQQAHWPLTFVRKGGMPASKPDTISHAMDFDANGFPVTDKETMRFYSENGMLALPVGPAYMGADRLLNLFSDHHPILLTACRNALEAAEVSDGVLHPNAGFFSLIAPVRLSEVISHQLEHIEVVMCNQTVTTVTDWSDPNAEIAFFLPEVLQVTGSPNCHIISYDGQVRLIEKGCEQLENRSLINNTQAKARRKAEPPMVLVEEAESSQIWRRVLLSGQSIARECHFHRTERLMVLAGHLEVSLDGHTKTISEGQSVIVQPGTGHALANNGDGQVVFYEIRSGLMMNEDDRLLIPDEGPSQQVA